MKRIISYRFKFKFSNNKLPKSLEIIFGLLHFMLKTPFFFSRHLNLNDLIFTTVPNIINNFLVVQFVFSSTKRLY